MLMNTPARYGLIAQSLHWLIAFAILGLLVLGLVMHDLPAGTADEVALKFRLYSLHKTLGMAVFCLALVRIVWALAQPRPRPLHASRRLETFAAATVHGLLYGAMLAMPVTGWLHHAATEGLAPIWGPFPQGAPFIARSPALAELFSGAHGAAAWLLVLAFLAHLGGAAKHVLIDRDDTLRRMLPGAAVSAAPAAGSAPRHGLWPPALAGLIFAGLAAFAFAGVQPAPPPAMAAQTDEPHEHLWRIDTASSRLGIEVIVQGSPVTGDFADWRARIRFDPDNLDRAFADVRIAVASLDLGSIGPQAMTPDYLDAEAHPEARFTANRFARREDGRFQAQGRLTLAGETRDVLLVFSFMPEGPRARVQGEARVDRLDFAIGPEGDLVGRPVRILLDLSASAPG